MDIEIRIVFMLGVTVIGKGTKEHSGMGGECSLS